MEKMDKSNEQWQKELSPDVYKVCRLSGTETPFTGKYYHWDKQGVFNCAACQLPLFKSADKYDSGSGWPSFFETLDREHVELKIDNSHNMERIEVLCARCGSHLGHLFDDGPRPTGKRYCINSLSLGFKEE